MAKPAKSKASMRNIVAVGVIAVVAAAAFGLWSAFGASAASQANALVAVVHDGDGGTHEYALDTDAQETITTSLGSNLVVVSNGRVHVQEADCPNHDCIKQGEIDTPGKQIVCLPHKLWIEIVSADSASSTRQDAANADADDGSFDVRSR